eukprot:scaffold374_cov380-Prasinococcus_capsulatus_cf.AAC.15
MTSVHGRGFDPPGSCCYAGATDSIFLLPGFVPIRPEMDPCGRASRAILTATLPRHAWTSCTHRLPNVVLWHAAARVAPFGRDRSWAPLASERTALHAGTPPPGRKMVRTAVVAFEHYSRAGNCFEPV